MSHNPHNLDGFHGQYTGGYDESMNDWYADGYAAEREARYIAPTELARMSHNEREEYMDSLAWDGLDEGPEWDALYNTWAIINGEEVTEGED